jgi:hypothetical protein
MPCSKEELEKRERQILASYAQLSGETRGRVHPNRLLSGALNISATAIASFIRARFAGWNTRRRFSSTARAIICARG